MVCGAAVDAWAPVALRDIPVGVLRCLDFWPQVLWCLVYMYRPSEAVLVGMFK
jgi:hypothetical protein|eukprot:COSAG06_NODE_5547_length_3413_cov_604.169282_1_plen_53_part_00